MVAAIRLRLPVIRGNECNRLGAFAQGQFCSNIFNGAPELLTNFQMVLKHRFCPWTRYLALP